MEVWDGYFKDGTLSGIDLIRDKKIPRGQYHLVCEVLVKHIDGDYLLMQRDCSKPMYPGYFEATAGGSALKGEDKITCIRRELFEETGIVSNDFQEIAFNILESNQCIFYSYLCITDCSRENIKLQIGETISFKWISEEEFIRFINSKDMIETQKSRYLKYFKEKGFVE